MRLSTLVRAPVASFSRTYLESVRLQKNALELLETRRRLSDESNRRDQLEQMLGLLRSQLARVTAEAEDGAATINKLKAQIMGLTGPDGVNAMPDLPTRAAEVCSRSRSVSAHVWAPCCRTTLANASGFVCTVAACRPGSFR